MYKNYDKNIELILLFFSVTRVFLVSLILYIRGFRNDILTYVLTYLAFTSFLRFYYHYLKKYNLQSKKIYYIDKFQDVNAIGLFFSSLYIIYYVFF